MAIPEEAQDNFKDVNVLFTGIGKINAAYRLTKELTKNKYDLVMNLGTAGSGIFVRGSVLYVGDFRDADCEYNPHELGYQPLYPTYPDILAEPEDTLKMVPCFTSDSFVEHGSKRILVDMEAYALAQVCIDERVQFVSYKCVTDNLNSQSLNDWKEYLPTASLILRGVYDRWKSKQIEFISK